MKNVEISEKAGAQFNRISLDQLVELGVNPKAIKRRLASGHLTRIHPAVFAVPPVDPEDDWGKWMAAVLTAPGSVLSHVSAAVAWGFWSQKRSFETITRPGSGGPRRYGDLLVHMSGTVERESTTLRGIAITAAPRTILDLSPHIGIAGTRRCVRESVRLGEATVEEIAAAIGRDPRRRGSPAVAAALTRYSGLPIERARSGAEVRAMETLRDAGRPLPALNVRRAGEEADLSWESDMLIIEIDGGPFHLDAGEDARKQGRWEAAGWLVRRLDADLVYKHPESLLALAPA